MKFKIVLRARETKFVFIFFLLVSCGQSKNSAMFFLNPAQGGPNECPFVKVVETDGERISLREHAGKQHKKIASLNPGKFYKVLAVQDSKELIKHDTNPSKQSTLWYQVENSDVVPALQGWATAVYLECADQVPETLATDYVSDGEWLWPVTGESELLQDSWKVSLPFGVSGVAVGHLGSDFGRGSNLDRPVYAVADGELVYLHQVAGSNWVDFPVLRHTLNKETSYGDRVVYSRYGHIKIAAGLAVGSVIKKGEIIGHIALNGSFAPHLHFEICNQNCFSQRDLLPGAGYSKTANFPETDSYVLKGARYYNPATFIMLGGKL